MATEGQQANETGPRRSVGGTEIEDTTFAAQREVYRGEELVNGRNPKAVDQLGTHVLLGFRRKVFALAILQCGGVLVIAWALANIPFVDDLDIAYTTDNLIRDGIIIVSAWLMALVSLGVVSVVRFQYPKNMIGLAIFTIFMSWAIAVLAGPNVHLGLGIILLGLFLTALLTSFPCGGKVIEVFPVSVGVMLLTNVLTLVWHYSYNTFIGVLWVILLMVMNTVAICWAGYQMDYLSSRLMVDEFLLPVILMWAEMIVALFIMMSFEAMASNMGECGDSCYMWGHTTWHCDCWIYADGSHGSDRYRRQRPPAEEQQAPGQEAMPTAAPPDAPAAVAPAAAPAPAAAAAPQPETIGATDGAAV